MAKGSGDAPGGYRPGKIDPRLIRDAVHTDLRVISRFKAPARKKKDLPPPNTELNLAIIGRPVPDEGPAKPPAAPNTAFDVKMWRPRSAPTPPQGIGSRRPPGG